MAITREKKGEIIEKVRDIAAHAKTIVFARFHGLSVAQQSEMRKILRAQQVGYTVVKKTLLHRALEGKFKGEIPALEGEIALAYGDDELAPARELSVFIKKFGDRLAFAGGVFGGDFVGKETISSIAAIPPLNVLRAQFVQLVNSPLQRFAAVLDGFAKTKSRGVA